MRKYIIPILVWLIYNLLKLTWRVTVIEPDEMKKMSKSKQPFILAHWHGDELVLLMLIRRYRIATITSTSKDGEMMNILVKLVGGVTSRGSSTRGGVEALKGLLRLVKKGHNSSFAVDGPKGPIYKVKPGIFELSRLTHSPIFWSGVSCDKAWEFPKSWNKTYLPKPFAKITVKWHGPMQPIDKTQDPRSQELAQTLEQLLHAAKHQAGKNFAASVAQC